MRTLVFLCGYLAFPWQAYSSLTADDAIQYGKEKGQMFTYEFDIEATVPDGKTTYKGTTSYTVEELSDDQLRLVYRGGLQEFDKPKENSTGFPSFPRPVTPAGFGGPFANSDFRGRMQTSNRFTLNRKGDVLSMEGDSQLPFLLGNVSLLPFESLPTEGKEKWTHDFGVTINSLNQSPSRRFGYYRPFGPFSNRETQKIQAASESAEYAIESKTPQTVVVKKIYHLKTVAVQGESIEMTGEGKWTFHIAEKIPESGDFKLKLSQQENNITIAVPITVKFQRVPPEVIAKRLEEAQQKAIAAKEEADRPLTERERADILRAIEKGTQIEAKDALEKLASKTPQAPDPEIAAAMEKATKNSSLMIVHFAERALPKWAPEFSAKYGINKLYKGQLHVPSTDKVVDSKTPLYAGQIVQMQEHGSVWQAAVVQRLKPDGEIELGFLMGGNPVRTVTLPRSKIQLAPEEVVQPPRPAESPRDTKDDSMLEADKKSTPPSVIESDLREWLDSTGRHKIKARFLRLIDGTVYLKSESGSERKIPLERLSEKDQAFAKQAEETKDNPFME
ncbi:MAG: hypothetical protein LW870_22820 [Pirellula sp.]|nr:hypothetical protein [Pirellula sp.]